MNTKYRVWNKKTNSMAPEHGVLAKIEWGQDYIPNKVGVYEYKQINEEGDGDWDGYELEKGEFILMQFTGLKGKKGRDAYESDLYTCEGSLYQIKWNNVLACFDAVEIDKPILKGSCNIVYLLSHGEHKGNIHENPELLK